MFDPIQWLDDCEAALGDADFLASWLARSGNAGISDDLEVLRIRIAVLRAELQRARADLTAVGRAADGPDRQARDTSLWGTTAMPWSLRRE